MAEDAENDDQWLYGDNPDLPTIENNSEPLEDLNEQEETTNVNEDDKEVLPDLQKYCKN